ncbi:translation initiation factor IF-2 [Limibacter armeniacum]|uniref:translation initiation factor IF-2 n=1 Tax=Limibacter armeniacum TaxID=466084 RepID=UPI002FE647D7
MADQKMVRLSQAARNFNVGKDTLIDYLANKGHEVKNSPNTKLTGEQYGLLEKAFASSKADKEEAKNISIATKVGNTVIDSSTRKHEEGEEEDYIPVKEPASAKETESSKVEKKVEEPETFSARPELKVVGKIDLDEVGKAKKKEEKPAEEPKAPEQKEEKPAQEKEATSQPTATASTEKKEQKEEPAPKKVEEKEPQQQQPVAPAAKQETAKKEDKTENKSTADVPASTKAAAPKEEKKVEDKQSVEQTEGKVEAPEKTVASEEKKPAADQQTKQVDQDKDVSKQTPQTAAQDKADKMEVINKEVKPEQKSIETSEKPESKTIEAKADSLPGLKVLGKIELPEPGGRRKKAKPIASSDDTNKDKGGRRKKKRGPKDQHDKPAHAKAGGPGARGKDAAGTNDKKKEAAGNDKKDNKGATTTATSGKQKTGTGGGRNDRFNRGDRNDGGNRRKDGGGRKKKEEITDTDIKKGIKSANTRIGAKGNKASRGKYKKEKRSAAQAAEEQRMQQEMAEAAVLRVTEYISTNELSTLMGVSVNDIIAKCMQLGMFISINQRLDAETIELVAEEFGFEVKFTSAEEETDVLIEEHQDKEEELEHRAPIVTIMGHVDHGKTSLLDYIRSADVASGEAGGITQHIGAYDVMTKNGNRIAFLDTPGHEAFTAMRARGAKLTDVAIIVIAADDRIMPQTIEAINHAQVAGVPIVFALNKVDKPAAEPNKIREGLANMNILVEDWGGKYQAYEISAKTGMGIDELLEGVLLEAEVLELKANPNKNAIGTVVEASLDKGRGYVSTIMVQAGTMSVGDVMLAGPYYGKVKAMTDHRGNRLEKVGPSTPVQVLGLNGAPQAGDRLTVMDSEREARELATKREQIQREQSIRATQRTTLDMIGKRIAQGSFEQLNVIVKGDVDGSVEALSDSLLKLSTDEVEVRIIHKAVGAISESDIMLASADKDSDATTIVIGFQVRPTANARKIAEREGIEIRTYSVIYDAINEVKDAMEGLLSPDIEEEVVGNIEVREVFKISKVGTVAGCFVTEGYVKRNSKVRLIRDGIVIYGGEQGGEIQALKRFKDDVNEVKTGYECGLSLANYNDIKVGDNIEVFEEREVKRTL